MAHDNDSLKEQEDKRQDSKEAAILKSRREFGDRVARLVMQKLGTPHRFYRVDGHFLFDKNFRVNVWVNEEDEYKTDSKKMYATYFVKVAIDEKSENEYIKSSVPEIKEIKSE
jgi:hypothetical protein